MRDLNGPYLFILITLMIDAIGIGIVFPIMPDLMVRVGAVGTAEGSIWAGVLMSAYAAAQFLFAPIIGSISDAWGRKPLLLAALAFLALDYVVMAIAGTLWLLLVGRTLAGVAGASYTTATAYISDITPREKRAARFGMIGAAFGTGFILGPALGGLAASWHITAPFWLAAIMSAINVVFGLFVLPESLNKENRRTFGRRDLNPFATILQAFRMPALVFPLVCLFVVEFANISYATLWAFWGREVFGWSTLIIGLSLSIYGALAVVAQAGVMPAAVKLLGERRLVIVGLVVASTALVGFGFTSTLWAVAIFLPIAALADLLPAALTAVAANSADETKQGMVQGVIAALASIAALAAPLVFTPFFGFFARADTEHYFPGAPFLLAALMVAGLIPIAVVGKLGDGDGPRAHDI